MMKGKKGCPGACAKFMAHFLHEWDDEMDSLLLRRFFFYSLVFEEKGLKKICFTFREVNALESFSLALSLSSFSILCRKQAPFHSPILPAPSCSTCFGALENASPCSNDMKECVLNQAQTCLLSRARWTWQILLLSWCKSLFLLVSQKVPREAVCER